MEKFRTVKKAGHAELIEKKYGGIPEDRHDRELMFASLTRMGYSSSDIRDAVRLLQNK